MRAATYHNCKRRVNESNLADDCAGSCHAARQYCRSVDTRGWFPLEPQRRGLPDASFSACTPAAGVRVQRHPAAAGVW